VQLLYHLVPVSQALINLFNKDVAVFLFHNHYMEKLLVSLSIPSEQKACIYTQLLKQAVCLLPAFEPVDCTVCYVLLMTCTKECYYVFPVSGKYWLNNL
jgi:hypothetical protein